MTRYQKYLRVKQSKTIEYGIKEILHKIKKIIKENEIKKKFIKSKL